MTSISRATGARLFALLLVPLLCLVLGACESPPAFAPPPGPPQTLALDVEFAQWTLGTWSIDGFDEELATQLAKYNIHVVGKEARPELVARINLGILGYRQKVTVDLVRGGASEHAGEVMVPDLRTTTLDAAAPLVAAVVARAVWKPAAGTTGS